MTGNGDPQATETLLREALEERTRGLAADTAFVNATIDHSVTSLRRTRGRQLALTAGAAAAVVGLVAWQAPSMVDDGSTGPTRQSQTPEGDGAYAWALSLPRAGDADVAYLDLSTLVAGSTRTDLGLGAGGTLITALPTGWFAEFRTSDTGSYAGSSTAGSVALEPGQYGQLNPQGEFTPYGYQPPGGGLDGVAVSPDGTRIAYGDAVVATGTAYPCCTATGETGEPAGIKVADLPSGAVETVDWTSAGLVYRDGRHHFWLWSPGSGPVRLPYDEVVPGGFGYTRDGNCVAVTRVGADESAPTYRLCDEGEPLTVSSGRLALMSDGEFVNLEGGVDFMTIPPSMLAALPQLLWESDDSLILVVLADPANAVLVRCTVHAGRCERVSDRIRAAGIASLPAAGS
jgi:hypothetical protein